MNVEAETEATPAEKATKDLVETCEVQVIRHSQDPDYHGARFAQYCSQNQSLEGCLCFHPSRLRFRVQLSQTTGFLLLSRVSSPPNPKGPTSTGISEIAFATSGSPEAHFPRTRRAVDLCQQNLRLPNTPSYSPHAVGDEHLKDWGAARVARVENRLTGRRSPS